MKLEGQRQSTNVEDWRGQETLFAIANTLTRIAMQPKEIADVLGQLILGNWSGKAPLPKLPPGLAPSGPEMLEKKVMRKEPISR